MSHLLMIGFGYSAAALARRLPEGMRFSATVRRQDDFAKIEEHGGMPLLFDGRQASAPLSAVLPTATHLFISAPPGEAGDPFLACHRGDLERALDLRWIGYCSTISVYGNRDGGLVDETTPPAPALPRAKWRAGAEADWLNVATRRRRAVQIFRLGGIYGPGRNTLCALADGSQKRIVKPGHVFNRIHVEDVAGLALAGMMRPDAGPVFNGVDDEPAPPQDVVVYAASLMSFAPPPALSLEEARLSPMGQSFYAENRRVSNALTKRALDYRFLYPTYREGLAMLANARDWERAAPRDA